VTEKNQSKITRTVTDIQKIKDAILISLTFIVLCWIPFLMDSYLGYDLKDYGMQPRTIEGLLGLITMHFLHGGLDHITQNSLGIIVLNTFLFYFYRPIAWKVFIRILLISPVLLWIVGRPSNHIGASLLLYGEFAFLAASGFIRKNPILMRVSLAVVFFYGSLVWYLFPVDARISWEGHASGFFVGTILAILFRMQGPQRKVYQYELEPELPDDENAYWKLPNENKNHSENESSHNSTDKTTTVTVRYHYKDE